MNLKRCPGCNKIINVDDLKDIDPKEIIGCGLNKNNFIFCNECEELIKNCYEFRNNNGWDLTTAKEYGESQ